MILGLQGDDRIWSGTGGRDILHAGNGDDQVYAGSGGDLIVGGYGSDVLFGGAGADAFLVFPDDSRPDFDPDRGHSPGPADGADAPLCAVVTTEIGRFRRVRRRIWAVEAAPNGRDH